MKRLLFYSNPKLAEYFQKYRPNRCPYHMKDNVLTSKIIFFQLYLFNIFQKTVIYEAWASNSY